MMEQAMSAGVQALEKTAESRSDHPREGKRTERARLQTNGCILSRFGTSKSEFRFNRKRFGAAIMLAVIACLLLKH